MGTFKSMLSHRSLVYDVTEEEMEETLHLIRERFRLGYCPKNNGNYKD